MAKKRGRAKKILGLAALAGVVAWIVGRKRSASEPEGIWRDATTDTTAAGGEAG